MQHCRLHLRMVAEPIIDLLLASLIIAIVLENFLIINNTLLIPLQYLKCCFVKFINHWSRAHHHFTTLIYCAYLVYTVHKLRYCFHKVLLTSLQLWIYYWNCLHFSTEWCNSSHMPSIRHLIRSYYDNKPFILIRLFAYIFEATICCLLVL